MSTVAVAPPPAIERVSNPDAADFIERYAKRGRPAIITNATNGWACRSRWSDEYLTGRLGSRKFLVNRSDNGSFGILSSRMRDIDDWVQVTFRQFLDLLHNRTATPGIHYMQQKTIQETFPELADDVDYPPLFDRTVIRDVNLWLSQAGSRIPMHYDTFDNLLAQVRGSKRIMLFAPENSPNMYAGRDGAEIASNVDPDDPDLERYPRFANATVYSEFVLEEGEILYIPAYWWHYVVTHSPISLSLNYWYHLVYGAHREPYIAALNLMKAAGCYVRGLPGSQAALLGELCRGWLDATGP